MSTTDTSQQKRRKLISRILQLSNEVNCLDTEVMRLESITNCEAKLFKQKNDTNLEAKTQLKRKLMILEKVRPFRVCIERNNCCDNTASSDNQTCDRNNTTIIEKCSSLEARSLRREDKLIVIDLDLDSNDSSESRDGCEHQLISAKFTNQ